MIQNGLHPQKLESLCKDCKGSLFEYGQVIEVYHSYCLKHDSEGDTFEKFLKLNDWYEK